MPRTTTPVAHATVVSAPCACGGRCPRCAQTGRQLGATALRALADGASAGPHATGLAVSQPGDPQEREADKLSAQVLSQAPATASAASPPARDAQAPTPAAHPPARRTLPASTLAAAPAHVRQALGSGGQALDTATRRDMEARFSADFSHVRLHSGSAAARSAAALGATAYTLGPHIVAGTAGLAPRVLAHELVHVVQQTRCARTGTVDDAAARGGLAAQTLHIAPMIQRDLAIEPPNPDADGRALSAEEVAEAIRFNEGVLNDIPNSAEVIEMVRDVIGVAPTPAVIDQAFVEAVVAWQAAFGLTQDGMLGPRTARPLFREIGAEGAGKGQVRRGPNYDVAGPVNIARAGTRTTTFHMFAEFESDPANGVFPSCCEVRQDLQWDAAWRTASVAAGNGTVPHTGFPAAHPSGRFIEDRDDADDRYGHRSGVHSDPGVGDRYLDNSGRQNQAFGHLFRGRDSPRGLAADRGSWTFRLRVIDVCNGNKLLAVSRRLVLNWL